MAPPRSPLYFYSSSDHVLRAYEEEEGGPILCRYSVRTWLHTPFSKQITLRKLCISLLLGTKMKQIRGRETTEQNCSNKGKQIIFVGARKSNYPDCKFLTRKAGQNFMRTLSSSATSNSWGMTSAFPQIRTLPIAKIPNGFFEFLHIFLPLHFTAEAREGVGGSDARIFEMVWKIGAAAATRVPKRSGTINLVAFFFLPRRKPISHTQLKGILLANCCLPASIR